MKRILKNKDLQIQILTNPEVLDWRIRIRIVDLIRRPFFKRFVSWIRFVDLFLKDSFCGFVSCKQKSQITRFVSILKDSYTNPASLIKQQQNCTKQLKQYS